METKSNKITDDRLLEYCGEFPNFAALLKKTDLRTMVCRFYGDSGEAYYRTIIGMTELPRDILLHLANTEEVHSAQKINKSINEIGIEMRLLSTIMGAEGFDIIPFDQFDVEESVPAKPEKKCSSPCGNSCSCSNNIYSKSESKQSTKLESKSKAEEISRREALKKEKEKEQEDARDLISIFNFLGI